MQHSDALTRLRALFHRDEAATPRPSHPLSGPTLQQQEPGLAQEIARYNLDASAWAAGSHTGD